MEKLKLAAYPVGGAWYWNLERASCFGIQSFK
jgi:hypothetical protein